MLLQVDRDCVKKENFYLEHSTFFFDFVNKGFPLFPFTLGSTNDVAEPASGDSSPTN